jgi:hypothetical protein
MSYERTAKQILPAIAFFIAAFAWAAHESRISTLKNTIENVQRQLEETQKQTTARFERLDAQYQVFQQAADTLNSVTWSQSRPTTQTSGGR